jgi:hypothetical protein
MVFFVLITTAVVAFMVSGATPGGSAVGCDSNDNLTTCEGGSPSSFLSTFFDVAVSGFSGVAVIDGFYVLVMAGILVIGFALIVAGIIGTPLGSG